MGKRISMSAMTNSGNKIAKANSKAKLSKVPKNFDKGMELFAERMARTFVEFASSKMEPNYEVKLLGLTVTNRDLIRSIQQKDSIVTILNGKHEEIHYWELWRYFEYGRLDKGIHPDPILKKLFLEFAPIWKGSLEKELTKDRK